MIIEGTKNLIEGINLSPLESREIMSEIMTGSTTEAQISAFLTALRIKRETVDEISAFASVMREFCKRIHPQVNGRLVDTCGTGGDIIKTFNVSTISAFVVAGTETPVAKHGNRSVTSKCGSADVLEHLGLNLNLEPCDIEGIIEKAGIGFMYAPKFHPAMKYAIKPRQEIGFRTVFNILGPLTNPACAKAQLLGVYSRELVEPLAQVLKQLGSEDAMVVHGVDGLDEISIIGKTHIACLKNNEVQTIEIVPEDFGFKTSTAKEIRGKSPKESADLTFRILNNLLGVQDPRREMILLNSAAGIVVGGKADDLVEGIEIASESIESGAAYKRLRMMIQESDGQILKLEELERKYG